MLNAGWKKKVPETYFRTVGMDDVARFHREMSPEDRLGQAGGSGKPGQRARKGIPSPIISRRSADRA